MSASNTSLVPAGETAHVWLRPSLTRWRVGLALAIALAADGIQILLGPIGWAFSDEIIDVVTMAATSLLVGFHLLLLPTFVLEFLPVTDMLPTWTGCVIAVVALRRRAERVRESTTAARSG
jgi:hypothetical protein